jgi:hypothetical protein
MDKLARYPATIREKLTALAEFINRHSRQPGVEAHCVLDEEHDQYLLIQTGWAQQRRVRGTTIYLRIRDGRVWVEEDWTEEGICDALVAAGIPEEDIVLAFQSPDPRVLAEVVS